MGKHEPDPRAWPGREEPRQPSSPGDALVRQHVRSFQKERGRLYQVANGEVRLGEPILRLDLEARVPKLAGNVESLPAGLRCVGMVADVPQPSTKVSQDEPEPASVANLRCDGLGLAHELQDPAVVTEGREGRSQLEPQVDRLNLCVAAVGYASDGTRRLLEEGERLGVGRAHRGLQAGPAEVRKRLIPPLSSNGII